MDKLLVIVSVLCVLIGFLFLSEATTGVGIIAAAGVLAVWARLAQASMQHRELKAMLEKQPRAAETTE